MKKTSFHKVTAVAVALFLLFSINILTFSVKADALPSPRNVILLIGDGMGFNHIAAARDTKGAPLVMDSIAVKGSVGTADVNGVLTDSAAAGTAMACGIKTSTGVVGMDKDYNALQNLSEYFFSMQKKRGLVTTVDISDATPAAFGAHVRSRNYSKDIAEQYLNNGIDILMGGGKANFVNNTVQNSKGETVSLYDEAAQEKGYTVIGTKTQLQNTAAEKLLALFSNEDMPYMADRKTDALPTLAEMTAKSIELLNRNPKGFFLMAEEGGIDDASHANNLAYMEKEALAFDEAVKIALDFAEQDGNTLVIVTADHETGGLTKDSTTGKYSYSGVIHTIADAPIFAYGIGAEAFGGHLQNNEINVRIKALYSLPTPVPTEKLTAPPAPGASTSPTATDMPVFSGTAMPSAEAVVTPGETEQQVTDSPLPVNPISKKFNSPLFILLALVVLAGGGYGVMVIIRRVKKRMNGGKL